ncbi:MAG: DUF3307 domain-containing protein [Chloroflexi bacterium]|nr:DUF3307 domain-containing protein [Chloroflexota bacterium]
MLYLMFVAHLLGDYVLQSGSLARWKKRSWVGVLVHGGIVTVTTMMCAGLLAPSWWPYALLIGLAHTTIDLVRARLLPTTSLGWELLWYILDQLAHLTIISLIVTWSDIPLQSTLTSTTGLVSAPRISIYAIGYLLLLNPVWILFRFTACGVWGADVLLHLNEGETLGAMVERMLIASCVLVGWFHLVPLVLLPRRLLPFHVQGTGAGVLVRPTSHWAVTILSVSLAVAVGLVLRMV